MLGLSSACLTFALLLFFTGFLAKRRRLALILMEFVATFLLYFDRMAYIYAGQPGNKAYVLVRLSNFMVFILTAGVVLAFNLYLVDLLNVECHMEHMPWRIRIVSMASFFEMFLIILTQFNGFIYYIDENNLYHRGQGFLICYVIPVICPLIQYTVIREHKSQFSKLIYVSLVLYIFVPIAMGILQIFAYGISIVNMAMVMVSISLYIFTYLDINETVKRAHKLEVKEMQEEQNTMMRILKQTATAFMAAVEKRDIFSEGRSEKVALAARRIAERLGKGTDECEEIYFAALLHNIGKATLPDSILGKEGELTEEEMELVHAVPEESGKILAGITEYPYLKEAALFSHEHYDGSGYPKGLKGKEIPEVARIIAVAEDFGAMTTKKSYRRALPYPIAREEFVKLSGIKYDPEFAEMMIQIMDRDNTDNAGEEEELIEKSISCKEYRDAITTGVQVTGNVKKITFKCKACDKKEKFSGPALVLFDSFDSRVHEVPKAIEAYHYLEYGEVWFDGHFISTSARNMECTAFGHDPSTDLKDDEYMIIAGKFEDHMKLQLFGPGGKIEVITALPDSSKSAFIGITGENCNITEIDVSNTEKKVSEGDIRKIVEKTSYIDRMESDMPNIQVDRFCSMSTEGVLVKDGLQLVFHTMSLPDANLVWHCPFVILFTSEDRKLEGEGFREFAMIKINGETTAKDKEVENYFSMKKMPDFPGWDAWKEINKEGFECTVSFAKKGNRIVMKTENLGIRIENVTVIPDGVKEVYASLTGDQVALTDIRIR